VLAGCTGSQPGPGPATLGLGTGEDSLRGTISVVGAEPMTALRLAGPRDTAMLGEEPALRAAAGLDVVVVGRRESARCTEASPVCDRGRFSVRAFQVRAAGSVPAIDGILAQRNGEYELVLSDGTRVAVPLLPPLLRSEVGARIYLAGPLDRAPDSYGILTPRP
jgi:hypothetical protein